MAKSTNQKLKLLYIIKILSEQTNEENPIQTQELIDQLAGMDIRAERKSIYDDINCLIDFGYDIMKVSARNGGGYYLASRPFEIPELKLLVDAVQASRFFTLKKSKELIKKIETLASKPEAKQLQRQVYVASRVKTGNENIYYNVDYIHRAIQSKRQITFLYLDWDIDKELKPRKSGKKYQISPWALSWKDENYYLIAFDEEESKIKHYRVDKMSNICILENLPRSGSELFEQFDIAEYVNKTFGMFGGRIETVTLQLPNHMVGIVIDRFGKEIDIRKREESHFSVRVTVAVSGQFFGWLIGLGKDVKIIAPQNVVQDYCSYLKEIIRQYES